MDTEYALDVTSVVPMLLTIAPEDPVDGQILEGFPLLLSTFPEAGFVLNIASEAVVYPVIGGGGHVHTQASADTVWTVNHNLGRNPVVTILSPGGVEVEAMVTHTSLNQYVINFLTPYSGTAVAR